MQVSRGFSFALLNRFPDDFSESFVDPKDVIFRVFETNHCRRQIKEYPKFRLLPLQCLLNLLALGDVAGNSSQAHQVAHAVPDLKPTVMNPADRAIRTNDSI